MSDKKKKLSAQIEELLEIRDGPKSSRPELGTLAACVLLDPSTLAFIKRAEANEEIVAKLKVAIVPLREISANVLAWKQQSDADATDRYFRELADFASEILSEYHQKLFFAIALIDSALAAFSALSKTEGRAS
jgi:hypothetical protein